MMMMIIIIQVVMSGWIMIIIMMMMIMIIIMMMILIMIQVDMTRVADKLMNKLAEEEKAVRKKKMEIGMWTNEMAASEMPAPGLEDKEDGGVDWGKMSEGEEEDIDMTGIELPDNLTFINSKGVLGGVEGKSDWVTGIQVG